MRNFIFIFLCLSLPLRSQDNKKLDKSFGKGYVFVYNDTALLSSVIKVDHSNVYTIYQVKSAKTLKNLAKELKSLNLKHDSTLFTGLDSIEIKEFKLYLK